MVSSCFSSTLFFPSHSICLHLHPSCHLRISRSRDFISLKWWWDCLRGPVPVANSPYRSFGILLSGMWCTWSNQHKQNCCSSRESMLGVLNFCVGDVVNLLDIQDASQIKGVENVEMLSCVETLCLTAIKWHTKDTCLIDSNFMFAASSFVFPSPLCEPGKRWEYVSNLPVDLKERSSVMVGQDRWIDGPPLVWSCWWWTINLGLFQTDNQNKFLIGLWNLSTCCCICLSDCTVSVASSANSISLMSI